MDFSSIQRRKIHHHRRRDSFYSPKSQGSKIQEICVFLYFMRVFVVNIFDKMSLQYNLLKCIFVTIYQEKNSTKICFIEIKLCTNMTTYVNQTSISIKSYSQLKRTILCFLTLSSIIFLHFFRNYNHFPNIKISNYMFLKFTKKSICSNYPL